MFRQFHSVQTQRTKNPLENVAKKENDSICQKNYLSGQEWVMNKKNKKKYYELAIICLSLN